MDPTAQGPWRLVKPLRRVPSWPIFHCPEGQLRFCSLRSGSLSLAHWGAPGQKTKKTYNATCSSEQGIKAALLWGSLGRCLDNNKGWNFLACFHGDLGCREKIGNIALGIAEECWTCWCNTYFCHKDLSFVFFQFCFYILVWYFLKSYAKSTWHHVK